jgi:hypothetical protein
MSTELHTITVGGLRIDVVRKPIKNLHMGVYPPNGRVWVAAPVMVSDDAGRVAVLRVKLDQQFTHKCESADGVLGCLAGCFQGFQLHESFAKNNRHRLANVPFRIRIPHREPALGKGRRRLAHHLKVLLAKFLEIIK